MNARRRNGDALYFDFKSSLEAAGKEAAKRSDERSKRREEDAVDREGIQVDSFLEERQEETKQILKSYLIKAILIWSAEQDYKSGAGNDHEHHF